MEIADKNAERSTIIIAVLTLVTIGLSLIVTTGQTLRQQEEAGTQYLTMTSRSVLQAVESSLRRGLFVRPTGPGLFSPGTAEFFRELEQTGDVLFVGVIDRNGGRVLSSRPAQEAGPLAFPPEALQQLAQKGEWYGRATFGARQTYVYGKRIVPGRGLTQDEDELPTFLVVGLDMTKHLGVYNRFRQNALFQAAYILAAAVFIWTLAMSFLKRREQAGRAAVLERFQARLLDNLPDGLITVSRSDTISAANPAAHGILGIAPGRLAGMSIAELPEGIVAPVARVAEGGSSAEPEAAAGRWFTRSVGGAHLEVLTLPIRQGDDDHDRLVIIRDRTQIRELEKNLSEAEKLAALGTLAAGVAHEIRNPLSALRGFAQYFAKKLVGRQPDETYAQTMVREADRLNRVITDLLYLSRPRAMDARAVSLGQLVADIGNLVRFDFEKRNITLKVSLGPDIVWADEDALKQAVLNLVLNSIDALEGLATGEREIHVSSAQGDGGTWVFVGDSGPGMSALQREQAFEPFFTTKKKGTGLGLALVHKTMREHDGRAQIDSEMGRGTTVSLFFPGNEGVVPCSPDVEVRK